MTERVRVAVQDSRRLVREVLAGLLDAEPDIEVVAVVARATKLPADVGELDVILTDDPGCVPGVRMVRTAGSETSASLVQAARGAGPGRAGLDTVPSSAGVRLTPREIQVVQRVAEGLSTGQIATALGIAAKSVDNHKQRIFAKLRASNSARAVVLAREAGLLEPAVDAGLAG